MRYTLWSRGRLIGETDLGFIRIINLSRSGWFHPTAEGERLVAELASPLPAMRAYLHRDAVDARGNSLVQPGLHQSELFADLAEAFQHLQALELELRREDGSVVPTSDIGIQDTERLLELFPADDDDLSAPDSEGEDVLGDPTDRELQDDVEDMLEADIAERIRASPVEDLISDWTPDDFEAPHPRYQIHVLLLRDDAIP